MLNKQTWSWDEWCRQTSIRIAGRDGVVTLRIHRDLRGTAVHVIEVSNGSLSFMILPERGMDVGELRLNGERFSWDRSEDYLLHPDSVDCFIAENRFRHENASPSNHKFGFAIDSSRLRRKLRPGHSASCGPG